MARLVSRLRIIAEAAPGLVALSLDRTADQILLLVKLMAPVDTGALRDSYDKEFDGPLHILVGSALLYSIFQELGTYKMAAQPHLVPAFLQAQGFFEANLKDTMVSFIGRGG